MVSIVLLLVLVGIAMAPCPNRKLFTMDADRSKLFSGAWYVTQLIPSYVDFGYGCYVDNYTYNSMSDAVTIHSYAYDKRKGTFYNSRGFVVFPSPEKFLWVTDEAGSSADYILGTDYQNFLVVYECRNSRTNTPLELVWVESREKCLKKSIRPQVTDILQKNNFIWDQFVPVDNENCKYETF